jgi:hypothetical protein
VITNLGKIPPWKGPVHSLYEEFSGGSRHLNAINGDGSVGTVRKGGVQQPFF